MKLQELRKQPIYDLLSQRVFYIEGQGEDEKIVHLSLKDFVHSKVGLDKLFKEYDDREIDILYSPRFHQVMILE